MNTETQRVVFASKMYLGRQVTARNSGRTGTVEAVKMMSGIMCGVRFANGELGIYKPTELDLSI